MTGELFFIWTVGLPLFALFAKRSMDGDQKDAAVAIMLTCILCFPFALLSMWLVSLLIGPGILAGLTYFPAYAAAIYFVLLR